MKFLNKLGILGLMAFAMSACVDQDPEIQTFPDPDVDFTYEVAGGDSADYKLDYYVVSRIQFNNKSAKTGNVTWNFGAPDSIVDFGDGVNPEEAKRQMNPVIKYKTAGRYDVTLTIDGVGSRTYPILIYDIVPKLTISEQTMELVELNDCKVSFALRLPNPENKVVQYTWTFPEGAKDENGNPITTFVRKTDPQTGEVECPKNISFSNLGSQKVIVDAIFDYEGAEQRPLEQSFINVQVASPVEAPTLYYAQVGGNIKAIKIIDVEAAGLPKSTKVLPYDLGVRSGDNPFNLLYGSVSETNAETGEASVSHWIYILDAGKQYYYINDEAGVLGDGKITAMGTDGNNVNVVVTNVGGPAFSDPFYGFIYDGYIYYTDRNQGYSKILMTARGEAQPNGLVGTTMMRSDYVAKNDLIPYYNRGISYGAISTGLYRSKDGLWWWGKRYTATTGIYQYKDGDIYATAAKAETAKSPYPIQLSGINFTTFILDEDRNYLYTWSGSTGGEGKGPGFAQYAIPSAGAGVKASDALTYVKMYAKSVNTTEEEGVYVKQMVVDSETGKVYFGFRPDDESDESGVKQGIAVFDPETGNISNYGVTNEEILGITINPTKTKLF